MGTMHLSDTVSYLDDIQPHLLTMLYAGVGSGKNHFINQLITGHTDKRHDGTEVKLDPLYVLLITSRRSKVNELLTEDDLPLDDKVGKWNWFRQRISIPSYIPITHTDKQITLESQYGKQPYYPRSFACTNAFIERYLQYVYHPQDITTHLWELFDLIVVDEAHSLVMDASYQTAPFHVDDLIREFCARHKAATEDPENHKAPRCKNLLMMTGSVSPMKMYPFPVEPHIINRMDECINVAPANIQFITSSAAKAQLSKQLQHGEKAVYFTNHTPQLDTFLKGTTIAPSTVALSFSKEEVRDKLAKDDPDSFHRMEQVEESIAKDNLIPDDIHLWLTTSRNKEGMDETNWVIMYVATGIWQGAGWGTIIYLAAISGVNTELYEAAEVDGCGRIRRIWYVTLPCIMPTIIVMLILRLGSMVGIGFERPYVMMNNMVKDVAEVTSTFVYTNGIKNGKYSFASAVDLFGSLVNMMFVVGANAITKRLGEGGLW